ncbi:MAG: glycogen synthase GlgA [Deltaproteobacteria bacterium]|nr:glycogen synthase GlgA [Deltaproteobacteria bacterium]
MINNIVFVSSEVAPYSKTGGLADVSGALPKALASLGINVSVVTPLYKTVNRANLKEQPKGIEVTLGGRSEKFNVFLDESHGSHKVYLLENQAFFGRDFPYGTREGDYPDNHLRFSFFSYAIFELIRKYRLNPDVIHCNDWQSALIPLYNHLFYLGYFNTLITIHNLAYQGTFPPDVIPDVGLNWELFNPDQVEFYGKINFLKAGIISANKISTVSGKYAAEIQTEEFGCGLEGVLRKRSGDLHGILNGADYSEWDPSVDNLLPAKFSAEDLSGKAACKAALQKEFSLAVNPGACLIGLVGRLAAQKGLDLFVEAFERFPGGAQFVLLGTGEKFYEDKAIELAAKYPEKIGAKIAYDNRIAHLIEAGCDMFLMPSRYEPCGLNQIYSLRYSTIPIVHATGGLDDTIADVRSDRENGNGFKFEGYSADNLVKAVSDAVSFYRGEGKFWDSLRKRVARMDFSWTKSAKKYIDLYSRIVAEV